MCDAKVNLVTGVYFHGSIKRNIPPFAVVGGNIECSGHIFLVCINSVFIVICPKESALNENAPRAAFFMKRKIFPHTDVPQTGKILTYNCIISARKAQTLGTSNRNLGSQVVP